MKDYYKVLNINNDATQQEIRDAYIKLIRQNHPDNIGDNNAQKASEITEAYSILSKPEKRKKYDEVYNSIYGIKLSPKEDTLFDSLSFKLQDNTIITPKKVSEAIDDLIKNAKTKSLDEDREIYLEAYYRSVLPRKKNYDNVIHKPRKQLSNESDKEYEIYINEYYNVYQSETIKYIENTDIPMPRFRKPYETDEHYTRYLEVYYNIVFSPKEKANDNIPLLEDKSSLMPLIEDKNNAQLLLEDKSNDIQPIPPIKKEKSVVKKRKQSKLKKLIKMIAFAATLLVSILVTKNKTSDAPVPIQQDHVIESTNDKNEETNDQLHNNEESIIDKDTLDQIDEMLNQTEEKVVPTVGDIVNLEEGQKFSYTSLGDSPSGTVGNKYTPPGNYIVDALAIVDSNNNLVAVTYTGGTSIEQLAEQYGVDLSSGKYKVTYHFSNNKNLKLVDGTADQRGWSTYYEDGYNKVSNILEQGKSK